MAEAFSFKNALYDNPPATTPDEAGSAGAGTGTGTGAGSSTGSPSAPALITNAYDPNRPTPYVAPPPVEQPKVEPPPTTQPPPRSQSPGMVGRGRAGAITSIATIGDQILRGAMQGRDQARQMQAAKTQKLMSGLQYNYAKAQANAIDIAQQPDVMAALQKDPKTLTTADQKTLAPLNEALAGTSSAWTMLDQMTNRYFFGDPDKAKGKGKGKKSDQPDDPMAMAASSNPQTKLRGIMMIRSKIGDTTPMKIREMLAKVSDPAAQAQRLVDQLKLKAAQNPNDENARKQLEQTVAAMSGKDVKPAAADKKIHQYIGSDSKEHWLMQRPDGSTYEKLGEADVRQTGGGKPMIGWSKDANGYFSAQIDPKTNQFIPGTENRHQEPPAYLRESIRTGEYHWVDEDGKVHGTPTTSVSRHVVPGAGGGVTGAGTGGAHQPSTPRTMVTPQPPGLVTPGNLPIDNRPVVQNADGSHSSEYSVSMRDDKGREVLVPTVVGGKFLTPDGKKPKPGSPEEQGMFRLAWKHYQDTGQHLGIFDNAAHANAYANQLHNRGESKSATAPSAPAPHAAGDRIIGDKGAPVDKQVRASTLRSSDQLRKLVPMWESSSKYMQGGKFDSAGDLSMVISAVRSMNPASSRLPDRELRLEMERGSYGERAQRWYTTATTGTMPDHMRSELWDVINAEIPNAARHTVTDWKTSMQGRPLPDHLKQFDTAIDTHGGGGGGNTPAAGTHGSPDKPHTEPKDF